MASRVSRSFAGNLARHFCCFLAASWLAAVLPAAGQVLTLPDGSSPDTPDLNRDHPNSARTPWTGPEVRDPDRPYYTAPPIWLPHGPCGPALPMPVVPYPGAVGPHGVWMVPHPGYGGFHGYPHRHAWVDAYRAARAERDRIEAREFNQNDMNRRKERLLTTHQEAIAAGLARLRDGDPVRAVVALTLASELDQGDPACRVHLAQARLALGQYDEAGRVLRRALHLQPKLVYVDLHLDRYFDNPERLDQYTDALGQSLNRRPTPQAATSAEPRKARGGGRDERMRTIASPPRPEAYFLLGYLEFQRGRFEAAEIAFRRVRATWPNDELTRQYLAIIAPSHPERDRFGR